MSAQLQAAKKIALNYWEAIDHASITQVKSICRNHLPEHFYAQGPAPFGSMNSPDSLAENYLMPLKKALPVLKRHFHIFMAGCSNGRQDGLGDGALWVGACGYLFGHAEDNFLGIPKRSQGLRLRWTEFLRIENNQIFQSQFLIDFIDWFEQVGCHVLPKPKGVSFVFPAPTAYEGILLDQQSEANSVSTLEFARRFIFGGLNGFDQSDLRSMGMADYFHSNLKWYGPAGIGGCLSFKEFEDFHQRPWLVAFPDRKVQDLDNLIAEDRLVGASSFPGVIATHTGPYQDVSATGHKIAFNGIDFWLKSANQFTENWVFVDMIHLFDQFGVDLFARMRAHRGRANG
jgi:predicted ester cyclase